MSIIVAELYDALRAAGVSDEQERGAAGAVIGAETEEGLAMKRDLTELRLATETDLAKLESRLIRWNVGTIIAMMAVFAAIVKLL